MPDYATSKVYAIRSHQTDKIYIGSTTEKLARRLANHRGHYKLYLKGTYHYVTAFELLKHDDHYIELIEEYNCQNREQLNKREGEVIRNTANCVNRVIAGRDNKRYRADNEQKIKEYKKQYRADHKEHIKAHRSVKYMCLCRGTYSRGDKSIHEKTKKHQEFLTWLKEFSIEQNYDFLKDI
jgi:hypothetical protein